MRGALITDLVLRVFSVLELDYFLYACTFVMKRLHDMNCLRLRKLKKFGVLYITDVWNRNLDNFFYWLLCKCIVDFSHLKKYITSKGTSSLSMRLLNYVGSYLSLPCFLNTAKLILLLFFFLTLSFAFFF